MLDTIITIIVTAIVSCAVTVAIFDVRARNAKLARDRRKAEIKAAYLKEKYDARRESKDAFDVVRWDGATSFDLPELQVTVSNDYRQKTIMMTLDQAKAIIETLCTLNRAQREAIIDYHLGVIAKDGASS